MCQKVVVIYPSGGGDLRTHILTPWAPVGAKNYHPCYVSVGFLQFGNDPTLPYIGLQEFQDTSLKLKGTCLLPLQKIMGCLDHVGLSHFLDLEKLECQVGSF